MSEAAQTLLLLYNVENGRIQAGAMPHPLSASTESVSSVNVASPTAPRQPALDLDIQLNIFEEYVKNHQVQVTAWFRKRHTIFPPTDPEQRITVNHQGHNVNLSDGLYNHKRSIKSIISGQIPRSHRPKAFKAYWKLLIFLYNEYTRLIQDIGPKLSWTAFDYLIHDFCTMQPKSSGNPQTRISEDQIKHNLNRLLTASEATVVSVIQGLIPSSTATQPKNVFSSIELG